MFARSHLLANRPLHRAISERNYDVAILVCIEGIQHEIYRRVLADSGGNQFDMPHSGVRKRQREGEDPCDRVVPGELYNSAQVAYLALRDIL